MQSMRNGKYWLGVEWLKINGLSCIQKIVYAKAEFMSAIVIAFIMPFFALLNSCSATAYANESIS